MPMRSIGRITPSMSRTAPRRRKWMPSRPCTQYRDRPSAAATLMQDAVTTPRRPQPKPRTKSEARTRLSPATTKELYISQWVMPRDESTAL